SARASGTAAPSSPQPPAAAPASSATAHSTSRRKIDPDRPERTVPAQEEVIIRRIQARDRDRNPAPPLLSPGLCLVRRRHVGRAGDLVEVTQDGWIARQDVRIGRPLLVAGPIGARRHLVRDILVV